MVYTTHKNGGLSSHYPCEQCDLEHLRDRIEHNGLGWTMKNLSGQVLINTLIESKKELVNLIELEVKSRDGKLQSNEVDED